jgi:hypothetical protein
MLKPRNGGCVVSPGVQTPDSPPKTVPKPRSGDQLWPHLCFERHALRVWHKGTPSANHRSCRILGRSPPSCGERRDTCPCDRRHLQARPLLLDLPSTCTIADVPRELRVNSSARFRRLTARFAWQEAYDAISVSPSAVQSVISYVSHQPEHHSRQSFEDEYLAIWNGRA